MIIEIKNLQDFTQAIGNENTELIIIDFYSEWCSPCKIIAPKFVKLSEKYPNVGFYKLNTDEQEICEIVDVCEITSLPTFCFFNKGKYITKTIGANDAQLENVLLYNLKLDTKI